MLVEFSISVMVLWLIAAATVDLGRAFATAHVLQSAARTTARELALQPRPWDADFDAALGAIFDPHYLVVDVDCLEERARLSGRTSDVELVELLGNRTLNQMLRPLMIFERVTVRGRDRRFLRYPGALLAFTGQPVRPGVKPCAATAFTVGIPEIDEENSRIDMRGVVEEIEGGAYSLTPRPADAKVPAGTAAVRLHYPYQAATLTNWRLVGGVNQTVETSETDGYTLDMGTLSGSASAIRELDAQRPDGELQAYAVDGQRQIPVYGGQFGLGSQMLLGRTVRPFRRVIRAQAMAPREVIGEAIGEEAE